MYCPRCGTPQSVGSRRCTTCGHPFTRQELAKRPAAPRPVARGATTDRYREWERGPGVGRRAVTCLAVLVLTAVLLIAGAAALSSTVVRPYVGRLITDRLAQSTAQPSPAATPPASTAPATAIPTPAPGTTQVVITQDEMNARLAEYADQLKPLEGTSVEITPQDLVVNLQAYGLSGQYRGQVEARDGRVVVTNGRIDGPLGWAVPVAPLESALNSQIQNALNQSGASVQSVTLQQGQMTLQVTKA